MPNDATDRRTMHGALVVAVLLGCLATVSHYTTTQAEGSFLGILFSNIADNNSQDSANSTRRDAGAPHP